MMDTTTNDPTKRYALAREVVAQEQAYLDNVYAEEQAKDEPCPVFSEYLDIQITALIVFLEKLSPEDTVAVDSVLDGTAIARIITPPDPTNTNPRASYRPEDPVMPSVVAREGVNRERSRVSVECILEERKEMPCPVLVEFFDTQITALLWLHQNLSTSNTAAIDAILSKNWLAVAQPAVQAQGGEHA